MEAVSYNQPSEASESRGPLPAQPGIASDVSDWKPLYDKFQASANPRTDRVLQEIWEYAKEQAPLKDKDSVLWEVTKLSNRLGSPHYGEKPWTKLIAYVSTANRMRDAESRLKEMEAHG